MHECSSLKTNFTEQSLMIAMIFFLVYLAAEGLVSAIRIGVTAFLCSIVIRYTASSMRHKSSL